MRPPQAWLLDLIERHPATVEPARVHSCAGGTHSRTRDGRIVCWHPPAAGVRVAVDAEMADQVVPGPLARRWGITEPELFWRRWTATEVAAKLDDVPILSWVSGGSPVTSSPVPVRGGTVWWDTRLSQGLRLTYGFLEPVGPA